MILQPSPVRIEGETCQDFRVKIAHTYLNANKDHRILSNHIENMGVEAEIFHVL